MNEKLSNTTIDQDAQSLEAIEVAVNTLASVFHEEWRKTRLQEDGSYEERVKPTSDASWIEAHGTDQVDIANTEYSDLPADWQSENKDAATVVVDIIASRNGNIDLSDESTRNEVGATIHDAWLSRNEWAKGGELDVPFIELSAVEQAKDIDQVRAAQQVFGIEQ